MKGPLRRGHINPVTGKIFEGYNKLSRNGEHWMTPAQFERRTKLAAFYALRRYRADLKGNRLKAAVFRDTNRKRIRECNRIASKKRRSTPLGRMAVNMRTRLWNGWKTIKQQKMSGISEALGCSFEFLRKHLEERFQPGMSWSNYGKKVDDWSIDHTVPLSSATTAAELVKLCHYTNLAPMWHTENMSKNNRM